MMLRTIGLTLALMALVPSVHAEDLLDWLEDQADSVRATAQVKEDQVDLVTLEARETEMYPKISPDGKYMLVISSKSHHPVISRRLVENGDPLNVVSDYDQQVLDSINWFGDDAVTFLSYRSDSLGLWQKPVEGGMIRRLYRRLDGELRSPIVLADGSLIAVRLSQPPGRRVISPRLHMDSTYKKTTAKKARDAAFDNWNVRRKESHLVRIDNHGAEIQLTSGTNPDLSPDGKRVVFSMQAGRSWHLFMMNADGSDLVQLTEGRNIDVQPSWSSDGKWVAFTSNRGEPDVRNPSKSNWDIWVIGSDGSGLKRLTHDKARDGAPDFARDGSIYFHSDRKVSKQRRRAHQVSGSTGGFHIWSVALPTSAH